jgi:hypothetical protein
VSSIQHWIYITLEHLTLHWFLAAWLVWHLPERFHMAAIFHIEFFFSRGRVFVSLPVLYSKCIGFCGILKNQCMCCCWRGN